MADKFSPVFSFEAQGAFFYLISFVAFSAVVAFFLYENSSKRKIGIEFVLAIIAAFTLGTAIFFGLLREEIIL